MEEYLPPEWQNEERMGILMSSMPQNETTAAFKGRLTFWIANIHNWIRYKEGLIFTLQEAQMAFRKGTQVPQCLFEVIEHMNKQGEIVQYSDLNKFGDNSESWSSWSKRVFVSTPSRWTWNKIQEIVGNKCTENTVFVDWVVLHEVSEKILGEIYTSSEEDSEVSLMFTVHSLYKKAKGIVNTLTTDDLNLILHFLAKKGRATIITHENSTYVKLAKPGQLITPKISSLEIAEYRLLDSEKKLKERIENTKLEMNPLKEQAKKLILAGATKSALILLKRKKRLEKTLETSMSAHENILICLERLKDTQLNRNVLQAFQLGVSAIKDNIGESGSVENVGESMDSLQEVLDECHDIEETISTGVKMRGVDDIDDETLQKELNDLLANEEQEDEVYLPAVPYNDPLASPEKEKSTKKMEQILS